MSMPQKRPNKEVKRQFFRGLSSKKSSSLDVATSNLLSRTLRKNSDKYKLKSPEDEFVIHKSTRPEDFRIFSTSHPIRESKLKALEQSEQTLSEVFHHGFDDSGSEDDEGDFSTIASPTTTYQDDILISVPGYSKEEITVSKRLNVNDRKNVRMGKVSSLERSFSSTEFLKNLDRDSLREYDLLNQEFNEHMSHLKQSLKMKENSTDEAEFQTTYEYQIELLRGEIAKISDSDWMFQKQYPEI